MKDLARIERVTGKGFATRGHVIALTNAPGFRAEGRANTIDAAFRLHDGRLLNGALLWAADARSGTMRGRDHPLGLAVKYTCRWRDYSDLGVPGGQFRYLLLTAGGRATD